MHQSMAIPSAGIVEIERAELVMMFVPLLLGLQKRKGRSLSPERVKR